MNKQNNNSQIKTISCPYCHSVSVYNRNDDVEVIDNGTQYVHCDCCQKLIAIV